MREIRPSGSAGGAGQLNAPFLPRSNASATVRRGQAAFCGTHGRGAEKGIASGGSRWLHGGVSHTQPFP